MSRIVTPSVSSTVAYGRLVAGVQQAEAEARSTTRAFKIGIGVLLGGMLAGSLALVALRFRTEEARLVPVVLGGRIPLDVPSPMMRVASQRAGGSQVRIDLVVSWPQLGPLPVKMSLNTPTVGPDVLMVALMPSAESDPDVGAGSLYGRFLEPTVTARPDGLIQRRFRADSPYAGEDLVISAPDGRRFAARCETTARKNTGLPALCMAEWRRDGVDVQVRFAPAILDQWEQLEQKLQRLVNGLLR